MDSTVCTALLNTALGPENVVALHIDNGFMRKNESQVVKDSLAKLGLQLHGRLTAASRPRLPSTATFHRATPPMHGHLSPCHAPPPPQWSMLLSSFTLRRHW